MRLWPFFAVAGLLAVIALAVWWLVQERNARRADANAGQLIRAGRTRDLRGQAVKLLDPLLLYTLGRHDVIEATTLAKIVEEIEPGAKHRKFGIIIAVIAVVIVVGGIGTMIAIEGRPAVTDLISTVTNPAILAAIVGGAVVPIIAARQERLKKVRRIMLRHRACPHCGYGLTGVPRREDDDATVCPECGCVWQVSEGDGAVPGLAAKPATAAFLIVAAVLGVLAAAGMAVYILVR